MSHALLLVLTLLTVPPSDAAAKIVKETLTSDGQQRSFYLFVPDTLAKQPAPLIVMLHGSGRDGRILLQHWQELAAKEGIILAGPDALAREQWGVATDGPQLFHGLVETLKAKYPVDPRRVYLFGHSAGAIHGLHLGVLESEYFAAVAAHAGVFFEEFAPFASRAPRKIPMGIWVGTEDRLFPLPDVRGTHKTLTGLGFPVELTEINRHTHNYYRRASEINRQVWQFLQKHQLTGEPRYQAYEIGRFARRALSGAIDFARRALQVSGGRERTRLICCMRENRAAGIFIAGPPERRDATQTRQAVALHRPA